MESAIFLTRCSVNSPKTIIKVTILNGARTNAPQHAVPTQRAVNPLSAKIPIGWAVSQYNFTFFKTRVWTLMGWALFRMLPGGSFQLSIHNTSVNQYPDWKDRSSLGWCPMGGNNIKKINLFIVDIARSECSPGDRCASLKKG